MWLVANRFTASSTIPMVHYQDTRLGGWSKGAHSNLVSIMGKYSVLSSRLLKFELF
jgi:hypothetical protein